MNAVFAYHTQPAIYSPQIVQASRDLRCPNRSGLLAQPGSFGERSRDTATGIVGDIDPSFTSTIRSAVERAVEQSVEQIIEQLVSRFLDSLKQSIGLDSSAQSAEATTPAMPTIPSQGTTCLLGGATGSEGEATTSTISSPEAGSAVEDNTTHGTGRFLTNVTDWMGKLGSIWESLKRAFGQTADTRAAQTSGGQKGGDWWSSVTSFLSDAWGWITQRF
ncbi:MAG: hypothetical protein U0136_18225 [Bdellovibrionota bacterium]